MARDYAAIMGSVQQAKAATVQNEVISLPPGYLVGFDVRLRPDYTVLIYAGAANVGGSLVKKATDHLVEDADWVVPKVDSKHYYIYLTKAGAFEIDLIAPTWNSDLLYYEHPLLNHRAIGKLFYVTGSVIFAIKEVEKTEQTVTVAPDGFTGKADYYCIHDSPYGNADQILINAAIRYLHEAYDGGGCNLLRGSYNVTESIVMHSNQALIGYGANLITSEQIDVISCDAVNKVNIDGIKITGTVGATNALIKFSNSPPGADTCYVKNAKLIGVGFSGIGVECGITYVDVSGCYCEGLATGIYSGTWGRVTRCYTALNAIGIEVAGQGSGCANNTVTNNTTYGIYATGVNCSVVGNYCEANGLDTGIANTNNDNFNDAGTDTQVYSNSWQQPVAGEPTQGELKWKPQATATVSTYLVSAVTTTAAWSSVSLGAVLPVGSKSIKANIYLHMVASAVGVYNHFVAFSNDTTATPSDGSSHPKLGVRAYSSAGGGESAGIMTQLDIPITADRKFYYYSYSRNNATSCQISAWLNGYTI